MIKARKRFSQFETISTNVQNSIWLKKGTVFIREKLGSESNALSESVAMVYLKDYTCALIDFLQMREEIILKTDVSEDESLIV